MGKYRVVAGQNIYDVALYLYGSIEESWICSSTTLISPSPRH